MIRTHVLDVYGVHIYLATTKREWSTLRRKLSFLDGPAPSAMGQASWALWQPKVGKSIPHLVFWLNLAAHQGDQVELVDTCAHEAVHGASNIFDWIGHQVAGDEPHAYLVGWLTRWLYEQAAA